MASQLSAQGLTKGARNDKWPAAQVTLSWASNPGLGNAVVGAPCMAVSAAWPDFKVTSEFLFILPIDTSLTREKPKTDEKTQIVYLHFAMIKKDTINISLGIKSSMII